MIRVIEQSESNLIQKVYTPKGETVRYQVVPKGKVGDSSAITPASTLKQARDLAGLFKAVPALTN